MCFTVFAFGIAYFIYQYNIKTNNLWTQITMGKKRLCSVKTILMLQLIKYAYLQYKFFFILKYQNN